jgi:hypothetical protein
MPVALENRLDVLRSHPLFRPGTVERFAHFLADALEDTDLKGSTELYERIGDMRAYGLVREHFGVLRDIIAERERALLKGVEGETTVYRLR